MIRFLNTLFILVLAGVLLAAYYQEYFVQGPPCMLCLMQRLAILGISFGLMMNLRFDIEAQHYGLSLLSAIVGWSTALLHMSYFICPNPYEMSIPVLGLRLPTWSMLVFFVSIVALSILLLFKEPQKKKKRLSWFEKVAFGSILALAFANILTSLCV